MTNNLLKMAAKYGTIERVPFGSARDRRAAHHNQIIQENVMLAFLLSLADEKDHAKIEYLYRRYHNDMLRFARSRLHQMGMPNYELDAEDAVQNAFFKITKYIRKIDFTAEEKEIKAYVLRIVANETINLASDVRIGPFPYRVGNYLVNGFGKSVAFNQ